jgi:hypothetical protein
MTSKLSTPVAKIVTSLREGWGFIRRQFKEEEPNFRLMTTLKIPALPIFYLLAITAILLILLKIDLYFFEASGLGGGAESFEGIFYDFLFDRVSDFLPIVFGFLIMILIVGIYVSDLLLRPFRVIGDFCEKRLRKEDASYDPDFFTDLKLLTGFAEFFFLHIEDALKKGTLATIEIPKKYTRIHRPVFEKAFFIQFSMFLVIMSILVSTGLYVFAVELHDSLIQFSLETVKPTAATVHFLKKQSNILNSFLWVGFVSYFSLFIYFTLHLYQQVSSPAFGIFATMRSFIKGSRSSRVHLIGYYYLRPQCRKLNKYLDHAERALDQKQDVN